MCFFKKISKNEAQKKRLKHKLFFWKTHCFVFCDFLKHSQKMRIVFFVFLLKFLIHLQKTECQYIQKFKYMFKHEKGCVVFLYRKKTNTALALRFFDLGEEGGV